jgi:KaiC/GvpD/RAD55 family RecA-like ATPase
MDANLSLDVVQSGEFDLRGMLAMLKGKKEEIGARWIVFDGIDVLLTPLRNPKPEIREIYRIRDWLGENEVDAAIFTARIDIHGSEIANYGFLQFMVDRVIEFELRLESGVALHRIQVGEPVDDDLGLYRILRHRRGHHQAQARGDRVAQECTFQRPPPSRCCSRWKTVRPPRSP